MMAIHPLTLVSIKNGCHLAHSIHFEALQQLIQSVYLLLGAIVPTKLGQIIHQTRRQVPPSLVLSHRHGSMSFGKLRSIRSQNERHVAKRWHLQLQGFVHQNLPWSIHQVFLRTQNVADVHLRVIHYNTEVVHGHTVLADDDEIPSQFITVPDHLSQDEVVYNYFPVKRNSKAINKRLARINHSLHFLFFGIGPGALHYEGLLQSLSLRSHCVKLLWCQEASVSVSPGYEFVKLLLVNASLYPLRLPVWTAATTKVWSLVPCDAAPLQTLQNGCLGLGRRSSHISVLDSEDHLATLRFREEPVEECRACTAYVQHSRWTWCKTNSNRRLRA
mmetsp:Transcript_77528/g.136767  ORF Transcript_77528/g.136767 Transcript_77528/m.136767 type:complete len:331 (+) Transcript_77528:590-1582(+)